MAQFHWCPMRLQMITIIKEVMKAELEHGHLNRVKNLKIEISYIILSKNIKKNMQIRIRSHDQIIGQDGTYLPPVLNSGLMETIGFMKD